MRRMTISLEEGLARKFDEMVRRKGYQNRSEAFRDLLRRELDEKRMEAGAAKYCVANVSYVYNHHERQLATRLTALQHANHDVMLSTMHAHLDHDNCIETVILQGPTVAVTRFAEALIAETGVRHGKINLVPVEVQNAYVKHRRHGHIHPDT